MVRTDDTGGVSILRPESGAMEKRDRTKTIRNAARRGVTESLMEERLQTGSNKWRKANARPKLEIQCASQIGHDCDREMDAEGGVEQMGDYVGADHIDMD